MVNINNLTIGGNLVTDPEHFVTPNGMDIVTARLACNFRTKNKDGDFVDDAFFFTAKMFGYRAKPFLQFHAKGSKVLLRGELREEKWVDKKTNANRSQIVMRVEDWYFADSGKKTKITGQHAPSAGDPAGNDTFSTDEMPF